LAATFPGILAPEVDRDGGAPGLPIGHFFECSKAAERLRWINGGPFAAFKGSKGIGPNVLERPEQEGAWLVYNRSKVQPHLDRTA
jgi:hypothetical protein